MTGLILLAAGASSRMGRPKQQLQYQGKSLLQHAVQTALDSSCRPVIVVLGAHANAILPEMAGSPVQVVHNQHWEEGMAASIRAGVAALQQTTPQATAAILMLCDQPFTDAQLLNNLVQEHQATGKKIVACAYNNTIGVPVLFHKAYFPDLLALKGQEGAKQLLYAHREDVVAVPFPKGVIDIDTPADYEALG